MLYTFCLSFVAVFSGDDGYCEGVEAGSRCDNPAACEKGHYCEFIGLCKKQSELGVSCVAGSFFATLRIMHGHGSSELPRALCCAAY